MMRASRGGLFAFLDRRRIERWLGVRLPAGARELRYADWQPSSDLAFHKALIAFRASHEEYLAFVRARGLDLFSATGPTAYLPLEWLSPPEIERPQWWTATNRTPSDAATGKVGAYGMLATKWEEGRVFVVMQDTGHRRQGGV